MKLILLLLLLTLSCSDGTYDIELGNLDNFTSHNPQISSIQKGNSTQVTLNWEIPNTGTISDYQISYQQGSTAPSNCAEGSVIPSSIVNETTRSHTVSGLSPYTTYSFLVCSIDSTNNFSSGRSVTLRTLPTCDYKPTIGDIDNNPLDGTVSFLEFADYVNNDATPDQNLSDGIIVTCLPNGLVVTNLGGEDAMRPGSNKFFYAEGSDTVQFITARDDGSPTTDENSIFYLAAVDNIGFANMSLSVSGRQGRGIVALTSGNFPEISNMNITMTGGVAGGFGAGIQIGSGTSAGYLSDNTINVVGPVTAAGITLDGLSTSEVSRNNITINVGVNGGGIENSANTTTTSINDNTITINGGSTSTAIEVTNGATVVNSQRNTINANAIGVFITTSSGNGPSITNMIDDTIIATSGSAIGLRVHSDGFVNAISGLTIKRAAGVANASGSAIMAHTVSNSYFNSSNINDVTICNDDGLNPWDAIGTTGLLREFSGGSPAGYVPYNGAIFGPQTFPFSDLTTIGDQGIQGISLGGLCP